MFRKLAQRIIPYRSAREDLKNARIAFSGALRSLRMERLAKAGSLAKLSGVKVNVGCGGLCHENWINVDLYPHKGAFYLDVVNGLPFGNAKVTHVHCEHFLEHLSFDDATFFLTECHRVLVPTGTMRIIVPDAEKYLTAYCSNDEVFFRKTIRLGYTDDDMVNPDLDTPMKVINQMFRMGGGHKFAWDFATLLQTASGVGFSRISRSGFKEAGDLNADLIIDGGDEWRQIESLYAILRK